MDMMTSNWATLTYTPLSSTKSKAVMQVPIFPLSVFLLPGGITRLRIFEQRYLNMIKNAEETQGFVISFYQSQNNHHISEWGSWVEIINFEMGDDNILIIDVKCKNLVSISNSYFSLDSDKGESQSLLWGHVEVIEHWSNDKLAVEEGELTQALAQVFAKHHDLAEVYQGEFNTNLAWICARWLELLPIKFAFKEAFVKAQSVMQVVEFLSTIIKENNITSFTQKSDLK